MTNKTKRSSRRKTALGTGHGGKSQQHGGCHRLTRKMEISWACGSGPWPSGPVRACGRRYGSGGLGRGCSVWVGFGDAAEGDFEAEGAELADVVGDLAADDRAGVRSSPGRGPGTACRGWTAACGRPSAGCSRWRRMLWPCRACGPAAGGGRLRGSGCGRPPRRSRRARRQVPVAFLGLGASGALAGLVVQRGAAGPGGPGGRRCGTCSCPRRSRRRRPGRRGVPSRASTRPAAAAPRTGPAAARSPRSGRRCRRFSRSMRASILASRAACSAVKNSAPSSASSSWLILRRAAAAGELGQHLGVAFPGDQVVHDVPAGHPVQVGEDGRRS